ncbi:hypothetical protein PIB30_078012 [Stylosanthes scabra]|uniref:Uncharacterized protein n=1 Tax=Stylosanthes scabra TaxID=79078 RepID=A0ABU6RQJ3_9FABA|nr:hypothetical protein [Stylosanthes scabra]
MARNGPSPSAKGKGKIYRPPTRTSPRLAALQAQAATNLALETPDKLATTTPSTLSRKPRMRIKYFTKQLTDREDHPNIGSPSQNPININSDSEEEDLGEDPKEEEPERENP